MRPLLRTRVMTFLYISVSLQITLSWFLLTSFIVKQSLSNVDSSNSISLLTSSTPYSIIGGGLLGRFPIGSFTGSLGSRVRSLKLLLVVIFSGKVL